MVVDGILVAEDTDGRISAYAGFGIFGSFGDGGPALAASLSAPSGLAMDTAGNLYVADTGNHRIRMILSLSPNVANT